jgi:hypothetical protein
MFKISSRSLMRLNLIRANNLYKELLWQALDLIMTSSELTQKVASNTARFRDAMTKADYFGEKPSHLSGFHWRC